MEILRRSWMTRCSRMRTLSSNCCCWDLVFALMEIVAARLAQTMMKLLLLLVLQPWLQPLPADPIHRHAQSSKSAPLWSVAPSAPTTAGSLRIQEGQPYVCAGDCGVVLWGTMSSTVCTRWRRPALSRLRFSATFCNLTDKMISSIRPNVFEYTANCRWFPANVFKKKGYLSNMSPTCLRVNGYLPSISHTCLRVNGYISGISPKCLRVTGYLSSISSKWVRVHGHLWSISQQCLRVHGYISSIRRNELE